MIVFIVVLFVVILLFVLYILLHNAKIKKAKETIYNLLHEVFNTKSEGFKLEYSEDKAYDFYYENAKNIIFIKIVFNFDKEEICVNNKVKWQLKKNKNDHRERYVQNIEPLMNKVFESNKKVQKIFIVYEDSRSLLKYINESELIFITPKVDVYGSKVITYNELKNNFDAITLEY